MAKKYYDVIIIGGGVSGAAIAWKLAKYDLKVLLLEKEADLATGTTKANTAIIHGGYNADPSTVKGRLNVKGNQQIKEIVRDLNVPFKEIGSLVVALEGDDISQLTKLLENGNKNGVKSLEIVDQAWLQKNEPNLTDEARAALYSPTAGVINPWEFALAMAENAVQNGLDIQLETKVTDIIMKDKQVTGVETNKGSFYGNYIVNAAGLFADEIARMVGIDKVKIQPRKGEYYLYDQAYDFAVNHIIFQLPKSHSKGIVVTKSVDNNLMIGPTSEPVAGKNDLATTATGLEKVYKSAKNIFPDLSLSNVIREFAGLRAADVSEDFIIEAASDVSGFINCAGIQSPGLSSAPAIADLVIDILADEGLNLNKKTNYIKYREEPIRFYELSHQERAKLVESDCRYGKIICRCETVTYKEIVDAIHGPIGARTVNAVKRRTRAGAGRCQGGFCGPKVVEIIAEELGISPTEVRLEKDNSKILKFEIKELLNDEVHNDA